jgi:hypothetical protein
MNDLLLEVHHLEDHLEGRHLEGHRLEGHSLEDYDLESLEGLHPKDHRLEDLCLEGHRQKNLCRLKDHHLEGLLTHHPLQKLHTNVAPAFYVWSRFSNP